MNLTIRTAEVTDASAIAEIIENGWHCAYKEKVPQQLLDKLTLEERTMSWQKILSVHTSQTQTLVAVVEGERVGVSNFGVCRDYDENKETTGELYALYVLGDYTKKGVGSGLMYETVDQLKRMGFSRAILWTLASNDAAQHWYEKRGWKSSGESRFERIKDTDLQTVKYTISLT